MTRLGRPGIALLWHFRIGPDDDWDDAKWDDDGTERLVGLYSSEAAARAAIARLRGKQGFRDWPGGFRLFGCTLDELSWEDGFAPWDEAPAAPLGEEPVPRVAGLRTIGDPVPAVSGMALYRVLHRSGDEAPDDKGIGIYSSRARAKAAIRRVRGKPGFRDWPQGFAILACRLDDDLWPDGFGCEAHARPAPP